MNHAQKAGESGMEDLLASIRKAIDDDFSVKAPAAGSAAITGSMRELRVRVDTAKPAGASAEPATYADRERSDQLARPADPPPKRNGFAGILSGAAELPSYLSPKTSPSPPPAERPSPPLPIGLRRGYDGSEPEPIARKPLPTETPRIEPVRPQAPQRAADNYARPAAFAPEFPAHPLASHARLPRPPASEPPSHLDGGLLSAHSALGAEAAFNRLADAYLSRGNGQPPLEDIARDLLRPMLKQWLDDHLAPLVERLVRAEIERVARRGGR